MGTDKNSSSGIAASPAMRSQTPHALAIQLPFRNAGLSRDASGVSPALLQPIISRPASPSPEFLILNPELESAATPTKQTTEPQSNRKKTRLLRAPWRIAISPSRHGAVHSQIPVMRPRRGARVTDHGIYNSNLRHFKNSPNSSRCNTYVFSNRNKTAFSSDSGIARSSLLAKRQRDNFQFHRDLAPSNMPSNTNNSEQPARQRDGGRSGVAREPVYWRVEGSLLNLTAVRPVGFFTWNAQSFLERWARRGTMGVLAIARPFLYATNRVFATRLLHTVLRGVSRDRLDLVGDAFFHYFLKPRLKT